MKTTLDSEVQDLLNAYREQVKEARLGNLVRRVESALIDLQDGLDKWGHRVQVDCVLGHDIMTPIKARIGFTLSIQAGDAIPYILELLLTPQVRGTVEADDDLVSQNPSGSINHGAPGGVVAAEP